MSASDAMIAHRYGYGRGRGPRRMPPRMQTSLTGYGYDGEEADLADLVRTARRIHSGWHHDEESRSKGGQPRKDKYDNSKFTPISFPTSVFGGVDEAVVNEMFGEDEEDAESDEDDGALSPHEDAYTYSSESSQTIGGKFKMPKLPSWALPAAAIAAGTAGAVGLGLALTSKKRKAKRAAREEEFGAVGDAVISSMFEEEEDLDDDDDSFGVDAPPVVPAASSDLSPSPLSSVPLFPSSVVPAVPPSSSMPSWRQYKAAQKDVFRATKKVQKAADQLSRAQSSVPSLPSGPVFGFYGCDWNRPTSRYGAVTNLQAFIASLPQTPSGLYNAATQLILDHFTRAYGSFAGKAKALASKGALEAQYQKFYQAAKAEGGFGPRASRESDVGIQLLEEKTGTPVPPLERQAMSAVSRAQANLIAQGLA